CDLCLIAERIRSVRRSILLCKVLKLLFKRLNLLLKLRLLLGIVAGILLLPQVVYFLTYLLLLLAELVEFRQVRIIAVAYVRSARGPHRDSGPEAFTRFVAMTDRIVAYVPVQICIASAEANWV